MSLKWELPVRVTVGVLLLGSGTARAEPAVRSVSAAVRDMRAARAALVRRLADRAKADDAKEAASDFHLTLDEGADRDELQVLFRRRGGKWLTGEAVVPYWRQETQVEKFSFLHRGGAAATTRDKFVYRVDPAGLNLADGRLTGTAEGVFRLDWLREERMVPGGRALFTVDGRWSLMDRWRIVDHRRPMRQRFALRAEVLPDTFDFALLLHGGIDGKASHLRFRLPQTPWRPPTIAAPRWNAAVHEADTSGLRYDHGALSGSLLVRYVPDPWYPKQVHHVKYTLSGKAAGGWFDGEFQAVVTGKKDIKIVGQSRGRTARTGPREWHGAVTGRAGWTVEGRYEASGDMGRSSGRASGVMIRPSTEIARLLQSPASPKAKEPTAALLETVTEAGRLYGQIRALRIAMEHYPHPVESALGQTRLPAPQWTGEEADLHATTAYVRSVRKLIGGSAPVGLGARGRADQSDPLFGPYYSSTPLAGEPSALPPEQAKAGPQRWQHIARWRVLGPFPQVRGRDLDTPALPDLVPAAGTGYTVRPAELGRDYHPPADGLLRWETVPSQADGTLRPPAWTWRRKRVGGRRSEEFVLERSDTPGRADTFWYAASEVVSPTARQVHMGLSAHDHAKLWINDRLVWVDEQREWGHRSGAVAVIHASLRKGVNRLLVRCRDDRGSSWVRVHVCTRGMPSGNPPIHGPAPPPGREKVAGLAGDYIHCYPSADPPLAWDVDKGINVLWRTPLAVARGHGTGVSGGGQSVLVPSALPPLLVTGGKILANLKPHALVCLDAETGKELWRRESNVLQLLDRADFAAWARADDAERLALLKNHNVLSKKAKSLDGLRGGPPASDGEHVYVLYDTGVAACYDLAGKRKWMVPTHMAGASMVLAEDRLVLEGAAPDGRNRGIATHPLAALGVATGRAVWTAAARGAHAGRGHLLRLTHGRTRRDVLLTRTWEAIDVGTGEVLPCRAGPEQWNWDGVWQGGDTLYSTFENGSTAVRFWIDADGQIGSRMLWRRQRHHAFVAGGPGGTVSDGKLLYALRLVPEHAKHCPAYALSLDFLEPATGNQVGWLNPVLRGTNRRMSPVMAGEYLFLADSRGGPHSGGEPPERRITVLRRGRLPEVACDSPAPNNAANPVFDGKRMYVVLGDEIVCVAVTTPEGKRYQDEQLAKTLLERIYREPDMGSPTVIAPIRDADVPAATPVVKLVPGDAITGCLVAGPFPEHEDGAIPASLVPQTRLPRIGDGLTIAGVTRRFQPLDRQAVATDTSFHNDGRLDDWQLRVTRRKIDVAALAGPDPNGVLYLHTILDNPRARLVLSMIEAPGMVAWLGGRKVALGEPIRLDAGLYPLLIRVRPNAFRRKKPQEPVDVREALDAGALRDVNWPVKWTVFGPMPKAAGQLKADQLAAVSAAVTLGRTTFPARKLPSTGGPVDLTRLLGIPKDGKAVRVPSDLTAYCFAEVDCPAEGKLIVNASADWFMTWHVDGKRVYSTLRGGNARAATMATAHTFAVEVTKGKHVLAVGVQPGSKGWSLTSIGGLATGGTSGLESKFPAPGGVRAAEEEHRASPSFLEADDPSAVRAVWLEQVRRSRPQLKWVARILPGTEYARKATRYLDALKKEDK